MSRRIGGEAPDDRNTGPIDEQTVLEDSARANWEQGRESFEEYAKETGESPAGYDQVVDGQVRLARTTYQKSRAAVELDQHHVEWDNISQEEADALQKLVSKTPDEGAMQRFLESKPKFLVQALTGGHGRYVMAKPKLGSEFVPDFLVAEMDSMGIHWYAVELESPRQRVSRQDGLPTQEVNHAIGQVRDWREWLASNRDYARKPRAEHGLGLVGIDARLPGLILIGRREDHPERYNEFRRDQVDHSRIEIHSYDWLVDVARSNTSGRLELYRDRR